MCSQSDDPTMHRRTEDAPKPSQYRDVKGMPASVVTATGDLRRGGAVALSDGRDGYVAGFGPDGTLKVQVAGGTRPIIDAARADPLREALRQIESLTPRPNLQGSPVSAYCDGRDAAVNILRAALGEDDHDTDPHAHEMIR